MIARARITWDRIALALAPNMGDMGEIMDPTLSAHATTFIGI